LTLNNSLNDTPFHRSFCGKACLSAVYSVEGFDFLQIIPWKDMPFHGTSFVLSFYEEDMYKILLDTLLLAQKIFILHM
jgi:hypothetical protein